jgi:hypothetical protein
MFLAQQESGIFIYMYRVKIILGWCNIIITFAPRLGGKVHKGFGRYSAVFCLIFLA